MCSFFLDRVLDYSQQMLPISLEFFLRLSASFPSALIFHVVSIIDEINQFIGHDYEECNTEKLIFFLWKIHPIVK